MKIDRNKLAQDLANELGCRLDLQHNNPRLVIEGECYLWFRIEGNEDYPDTCKVNVHGNYHLSTTQIDGRVTPEYYRPEVDCGIQVSFKRGAAAIAKDIKRRCLPVYLAEFKKIDDKRNAHDKFGASVERTKKKVEEIVGDTFGEHQRGQHGSVYINRRKDSSTRLECYISDETVTVNIGKALNLAQFAQLVALLKSF